MLTQAVGDEVAGLQGLAVSITVAALAATLVSGPAVIGVLTPHLLLAGFGLALLLPVIPFSLEMYALRRLTTSAFGTLMCLEPAIALVAGFALLGQVPRAWSLAGVAFVIAAGLGAERYGARPVPGTAATQADGDLAPDVAGSHVPPARCEGHPGSDIAVTACPKEAVGCDSHVLRGPGAWPSRGSAPTTIRKRGGIAAFCSGLELAGPGVLQTHR